MTGKDAPAGGDIRRPARRGKPMGVAEAAGGRGCEVTLAFFRNLRLGTESKAPAVFDPGHGRRPRRGRPAIVETLAHPASGRTRFSERSTGSGG